jgi:hypothetical protein
MELPTDLQVKLRIGYALSDRLAPISCAIVENPLDRAASCAMQNAQRSI